MLHLFGWSKSITRSLDGTHPIKPFLDPYNPEDTTAHVRSQYLTPRTLGN